MASWAVAIGDLERNQHLERAAHARRGRPIHGHRLEDHGVGNPHLVTVECHQHRGPRVQGADDSLMAGDLDIVALPERTARAEQDRGDEVLDKVAEGEADGQGGDARQAQAGKHRLSDAQHPEGQHEASHQHQAPEQGAQHRAQQHIAHQGAEKQVGELPDKPGQDACQDQNHEGADHQEPFLSDESSDQRQPLSGQLPGREDLVVGLRLVQDEVDPFDPAHEITQAIPRVGILHMAGQGHHSLFDLNLDIPDPGILGEQPLQLAPNLNVADPPGHGNWAGRLRDRRFGIVVRRSGDGFFRRLIRGRRGGDRQPR